MITDDQWRAVVAIEEIADGGYRVAEVDGQSVLLTRFADEVFALENRCSHAGSALAGGRIRGGRISCPLHGAMFDARTGAAIGGGLAPCGVRTLAVRVVGERVEVQARLRPGLPRP